MLFLETQSDINRRFFNVKQVYLIEPAHKDVPRDMTSPTGHFEGPFFLHWKQPIDELGEDTE